MLAGFGIGLVLLLLLRPAHPVAWIRVLDAAGNPVSGAVVQPDGMRTKPGPFESGHYGCRREFQEVPNDPVLTDPAGVARVPYPRFVFERIETGQISFSVRHPDFVPVRPFRAVSSRPPTGAPLKTWMDYVLSRVRVRKWIERPEPVVLPRGAVLRLALDPASPLPRDAVLYAQSPEDWMGDSNFWRHPGPGAVETRQMPEGSQSVRAIAFDAAGLTWFSDPLTVACAAGKTNALEVLLRPGARVRGRLDAAVPRPVTGGRVIAHVWPPGAVPQNNPLQWHAWCVVSEDGRFDLGPLPPGTLEVVGLCRGFVSTNGPGQFSMRYPQKHTLGTNDLELTLGMEPTARLEVTVTDPEGKPLAEARVSTWPNVRYGEWSATLLGSDTNNTAHLIRDWSARFREYRPSQDFASSSDAAGVAVIGDLPSDVRSFAVEHPRYVLPAMATPGNAPRREAQVQLEPGKTHRVTVRLEPRDQNPIRHY